MNELKRLRPDVEVVWRAYELRPEPVPKRDPGGEYLQRVWSQSVYPLAQRLGRPMKLPPIQPRSRRAHEVAFWARGRGRFDEMNEAIFRALFERGEDIESPMVLAALASSCGLDGDELKGSLQRGEHTAEVLADERLADSYGLRGVPAFVAAGTVLFGVQTLSTLEEFVRLAEAAEESETPRGPLPHLPVKLGK